VFPDAAAPVPTRRLTPVFSGGGFSCRYSPTHSQASGLDWRAGRPKRRACSRLYAGNSLSISILRTELALGPAVRRRFASCRGPRPGSPPGTRLKNASRPPEPLRGSPGLRILQLLDDARLRHPSGEAVPPSGFPNRPCCSPSGPAVKKSTLLGPAAAPFAVKKMRSYDCRPFHGTPPGGYATRKNPDSFIMQPVLGSDKRSQVCHFETEPLFLFGT